MSSHAEQPRLVALRAKIEAEGVEALRVEERVEALRVEERVEADRLEERVEADRLEAGRVEAVSF